jgi:inner membrane protein
MPSLIGHSLMGAIIYRGAGGRVARHQLPLLVACLFAANAPDLDFLPGFFVGDLPRFHHGPSHSIAFAFGFGLFAAVILPFGKRLAFAIGFLNYLSHVLMDFLIDDPSWPQGVPLLWPFSNEHYMAPLTVFRKFDYSPESSGLIATLFSIDNLATVAAEIGVLLPVLVLVHRLRRKQFIAAHSPEGSTR